MPGSGGKPAWCGEGLSGLKRASHVATPEPGIQVMFTVPHA